MMCLMCLGNSFILRALGKRRSPAVMLALSACSVVSVSLHSAPLYAAEYPAELNWSGRVTLTMPVSGVVESIAVQAGQKVKKGALLAHLDASVYKAGVAETRADMDRLAEEQADAKLDLERVQELYARTVASTTELNAAKLRFARANAGLAAAQARVERARHLLAETELRAPFDALILQRHAEPGTVIAGQCQPAPILTIAQADQLVARALLDGKQAASVRWGSAAEVLLPGAVLPAKVHALVAGPDQRYSLEVAIPASDAVYSGQAVHIRLP